MPYPQIVLDANVIVQALVRDLLLDADAYGLCRVRWTEAILGEARQTLIGEFGRDPARIDALLAAMRRYCPRAAIVGYEARIAAMTNEPKDRHVAAAAVWTEAEIATFNLRHFRPTALAPFGVRALHPDTFLMELYPAHADTLAAIVREQAAQRTDPPLAPRRVLGQTHHTPSPLRGGDPRAWTLCWLNLRGESKGYVSLCLLFSCRLLGEQRRDRHVQRSGDLRELLHARIALPRSIPA